MAFNTGIYLSFQIFCWFLLLFYELFNFRQVLMSEIQQRHQEVENVPRHIPLPQHHHNVPQPHNRPQHITQHGQIANQDQLYTWT